MEMQDEPLLLWVERSLPAVCCLLPDLISYLHSEALCESMVQTLRFGDHQLQTARTTKTKTLVWVKHSLRRLLSPHWPDRLPASMRSPCEWASRCFGDTSAVSCEAALHFSSFPAHLLPSAWPDLLYVMCRLTLHAENQS